MLLQRVAELESGLSGHSSRIERGNSNSKELTGNVSSATLIFLSTLEPELHEHKPQQHHNNREKERLKNPLEITSICLDIHNLTSKVC